MKRRRLAIAAAVFGAASAALILLAGATDDSPGDVRADATRRLQERRRPPLRSPPSAPSPPVDWNEVEDVDRLLDELQVDATWSLASLLDVHSELVARGLLDGDQRLIETEFVCQVRCPDQGVRRWGGTEEVCLRQCALDLLDRAPDTGRFFFAASIAVEQGDAQLYRDLAAAHPEYWDMRQQSVANIGPRSAAAVWWGDFLQDTAPQTQRSLWGWSQSGDSFVHRWTLWAAGPASCLPVGDEVVCP